MGTGLGRGFLKFNNAVNRFTVTLVSLCVLAIIGVFVWLGIKTKDDGISLGFSDKIDNTPTIVAQMREIGQWELLDETRTRPFFESGKWNNADRKAMADRARQAMRQRCLTKQNLDLAQRNAEQQVRLFLMKIK